MINKTRRAPKAGYLFDAKERYRQVIWSRFQSHCGPNRWKAGCVLMPSSEGRELEVALARGFREENIHIVDDNPAIIAQYKKSHPHTIRHGIDIGRVFAERLDPESIEVGNLDLTGCLSNSLAMLIKDIGRANCWRPGALVAITVLRGREQKDLLDIARLFPILGICLKSPRLTHTDKARVGQLAAWLDGAGCDRSPSGYNYGLRPVLQRWEPMESDWYVSVNGQSMLWAIYKCHRPSVRTDRRRKDVVGSGLTWSRLVAHRIVLAMQGDDLAQASLNKLGPAITELCQKRPGFRAILESSGVLPYLPRNSVPSPCGEHDNASK